MFGVSVRVRSRSAAVAATVRRAAERAVLEVAEDCLAEINGNGDVPYEEGTLARSGQAVAVPGSRPAAAVTYDTPYAVVQHEDPTLRHPRQGRHHWLEQTAQANAQRYFEHIASVIRSSVR